ncbi:sodium-coupled monocarboxylate transporter 2-like [Mytilus edulis]|uniref:sodium-coupled monocarboxylate transporter 2-like n=1 Tax=Mytilus edulis TaxID=6550 RepID=UPI0039F13395
MEDKSYSFVTGRRNTFHVLDYVFFIGTLVVSLLIGIFFGYRGRTKHSTKEVLLAGGKMHFIPVSMSLLASFMSAITLLGTPAEMYNFTTMYWYIGISYFFVMFMAAHIYLPVFYNLGVTSVYEYLEHRFSKGVRTAGMCIFSLQMMIYMSIVLYGPSLALNAVTGLSLWGAVASVGIVCMIYTALGGMKAVLWTDSFQVIMMITGVLATLIQGSIEVGGFAKAWEIAADNERVWFTDFRVDPSVRHSAWALVIGGSFLWVSVYGTNQAQVQRALTCKSLRDAKIALWLNFPGLCIILYLCCLVGIVLYAFYRHCDPVTYGLIMASDQLYPLFVMDIMGHVPGVPGLFVASIFSGSLSTLSSGLNSLSAVLLQDIVKVYIAPDITDQRAALLTKVFAVMFGIICLSLTYVASLLGGILQAALAIFGMLGAPMLGLFTLGMLFPWANKWGAYSGLGCSLIMMFWIGIGAYVTKPDLGKAPISLAGCPNFTVFSNGTDTYVEYANYSMLYNSTIDMTTSIANLPVDDSNPVDKLYTLSYVWYSFTAVLIVVFVGMIVTMITGKKDPKTIDARLICPVFDVVFPYLPEKILKPLRFGVNHKGKYEIKPTPSEMPLKDKNPSVGNTDQLVNGIDTEMEIMIQKPDEKEKGDVKFV